MKIKCLLIRHGKTKGNLEKRYIGCKTDEPLLEDYKEMMGLIKERIEAGYNKPKLVYVSPMKRCIQTADFLFEGIEQKKILDFRETDFGEFENKNYVELAGNPEYQSWIDSNGTKPFPGGESREYCIERTVRAFYETVKEIEAGKVNYAKDNLDKTDFDIAKFNSAVASAREDETYAFVIHGGSIMAIMSSLTGRDYYDFQTGCCDGYYLECTVENGKIHNISYDSLLGGDYS